jgi:hypothetical protein
MQINASRKQAHRLNAGEVFGYEQRTIAFATHPRGGKGVTQ